MKKLFESFYIPYSLREKIRAFKDFFNPRNKWVYRAVSYHWQDKDTIIENVLFAAIVDYVENEKCFETTDWSYNEDFFDISIKIKEIYVWVKKHRVDLVKLLDELYKKRSIGKLELILQPSPIDVEIETLEYHIKTRDTKFLKWIIEYRDYLWT